MDDSTLSMASGPARPAEYQGGTWGPFRLRQKVGQGAFGEVYRAFDTTLEREVALKLLLPRGLSQAGEEEALLREARAIARVRHNNVVPVYGVDRHDGRVGFWSDFVHGKTLAAIVATDGPLGPSEAAHIGVDVCRAVSAVHAAGLLHRDIKARNVMRESGGRILLMDFGLTHDRAESLRGGTPSYMAPELLKGEPANEGTDLYAVGAMLFYLVTGRHPVEGESLAAMVAAHEAGSRHALLDLRPDLPEPFVRAIETAIQPDPQRRFKSAGQMIAALTGSVEFGTESLAGAAIPPAPPPVRGVPYGKWAAGAAAIAVVAAGIAVSPVRRFLNPAAATVTIADNYQKAHDLLEHYYRPKAVENAMAILTQVIAVEPNFAPAYADLARANVLELVQQNDKKYLEPAEKAARQALKLKPDLASAYVTLGTLHRWSGKYDLAAQELDEALRLHRFSAEAHAERAELLRIQGRKQEAEASLVEGAKLAPGEWRIVTMLGEHYMSQGKSAQATELYRKVTELTPDNPRAQNNLGVASRSLNQLADAEAAFRKAVALEPTFGHYRNLGRVLLESGQHAEAQPMLERAIQLRPSHYRAWGFLADLHRQTGAAPSKVNETYRKAIAAGEDLRRQQPDNAFLLADLGYYYASLGMAPQSVPLLERAALLGPDRAEVLYMVALGYEAIHRRSEAVQTLRTAIKAGLSVPFLERIPQLSTLRLDPRYRALISPTPNPV